MKKSILSITAAAVLGLTATVASASPFTIDNGIDFTAGGNIVGNGSTSTSAITELGYTGTLGTSFYAGNPAVAGTAVYETNILSKMTASGFAAGAHTSLGGTALNFSNPSFPNTLNIDSLNNSTTTPDVNGFVSGAGFPSFGQLGSWGLTYNYELFGTTTGTDIVFNSGYFDIFYQDGTPGGKQVLRMVLTTSVTQPANLQFLGYASFDFDGNGTDDADAFVKSFWNDVTTGQSFYNTWLANKTGVQFAIDSNVNPPLPALTDLWASVDVNGNPVLIRQSTLDGSVTFKIPEPGSIALLGLGLVGLGLTQRRRKVAAK